MFEGSMVALVTPFKDNKVDEKTLRKLVKFQIENGTDVLVPCGTTGESATLSTEEHEHVIDVVISEAKGKAKVVAGAGSNNTAEALEFTKYAKEAGADGALIITPYYNKPTQEGIYQHFKALSDNVDIPLVAYNIASRTGRNIEPATMSRMAKLKNVVAVKEASGDLKQMAEIKRLCGKDFDLISGDDALTLPVLAIGGVGIISVVANIVPKDVSGMIRAYEDKNMKLASEIYYKLMPLVNAMFIETNPIPVKTSMGLMGMIEPTLRLPMCAMLESNLDKLKKALREYKLISV